MAFRDYIICGECETKIIYDGYDNGRDRLEEIWGDPNANSWTVYLLCPDCIKKMRADLAAARACNKECDLLLSRVLHELAGSASLCWEPKPTGVFATELALGFVEDAIKELRAVLAGEKK